MKRPASFVLLAWLLLSAPLFGQNVPLKINGDTVTVKVDRVIVIKEDMTVVRSFPFSIQADPGSALYFWTHPTGVTAIDKGDSLEISASPKGLVVISVKAISANLDKDGRFIGFVTKTGQITFSVGAAPEPKPPDPPKPPTPVIDKATAATYIYEKDQTAIPNQVLSALNRLNRERGIIATAIEADVKDGTGEVPAQYKVALEAAKKAGLPSLVVTAGDMVLSVVRDPKTEAQVIDAVGKAVAK